MGSWQAGSDIAERLLELAVGVVRISGPMSRSFAGRHVSGQLVRSATSAGANYEEACGSQSRGDFIHKLHLVLKELRESAYWLKLSARANLVDDGRPDRLQQEAVELSRIIGKSLVTAKSNRQAAGKRTSK